MVTKYRFVAGRRGVLRLAGLTVLTGALSSCSLDVFDPDVVTPDDVSDPASLPIAITGVVGDWQAAHDGYARYSGMLVDEFISSGTFPTRVQVDARQIVQPTEKVQFGIGRNRKPRNARVGANTGNSATPALNR